MTAGGSAGAGAGTAADADASDAGGAASKVSPGDASADAGARDFRRSGGCHAGRSAAGGRAASSPGCGAT